MRQDFLDGFKEVFFSTGRKALLTAWCAVIVSLLVAGCGGPLKVSYPVSPAPKALAAGVTVGITPFTDNRAGTDKGSRRAGKIDATVADMNAGSLTLSEDVGTLVTDAFTKEFSSAGYAVKSQDADFVLSGEVKEFRLDVGSRDEITIAVDLKIVEKETGRELWTGTETEKNSRYAGVMGNTRATLEHYITASLAKVVKKTIDETAPVIANTKAAYRPSAAKAPQEEKAANEPPAGTGRLIVATAPPRSKVYINGVYWGLSPFSADIEPGVYELVVKQKGFKENKEKVSVRAGQLTELEMTMEKE
ncbi:MAG: PEGA domain-containing protein [Deltaproteobacteria bacterium]|nr:PEGA domain-containing protein [Deltaproteobacteria bacterium]